MRTLNFGVLAHVDAGKTTLTERLLHAVGVIDSVGSVDSGTTTTDTLPLERSRGITIRAAVVSFTVGDVILNLIDTPGHPDFIAEVERSLGVLDGVVLVISAVEGVQAQTLVLMRALQRLEVPTLLFVNKIDRPGADLERTMKAVRSRLSGAVADLTSSRHVGTASASVDPFDLTVPERRDGVLDALAANRAQLVDDFIEGRVPDAAALTAELAAQTRGCLVHPVLAGSAITGAGVDELLEAIVELLPAESPPEGGDPAGTVFARVRTSRGTRPVVRMFSGSLSVRDHLEIRGEQRRVTSIEVFQDGHARPSDRLGAGRIGLVGIDGAQVGDTFGHVPRPPVHAFAAPALETLVAANPQSDRGRLHAALSELAEFDPLINLRVTDAGDLALSMYGEVQKEVIAETVRADHDVAVVFSETTAICVERPRGTGSAHEVMGKSGHPFPVTLGYEIVPAPIGSGVDVVFDVPIEAVPIHVFKTVEAFQATVEEAVIDSLREGLHGWKVIDCTVTLTDSAFISPATKARHYRKATPVVLGAALQRAGTVVCEPVHEVRVEGPLESLGSILSAIAEHRGAPTGQSLHERICEVHALLPVAELHGLQQQLPRLTHGEGYLQAEPAGYQPITAPRGR